MKASISRRDIYKKTAVQEGWRARSAYKISQIHDELGIFNNCSRVVDLCCAPGSWSQVAAKVIPESPDRRIIAIDLREIKPIPGVIQLRGDITCESTAKAVIDLMDGKKADLVMADGAPDTIGRIEFDEYVQHGIVKASLAIATMMLREGGTFVSKIFRTKSLPELYQNFSVFFSDIKMAKPRASRLSSVESFIVCQGFKMPENYTPSLVTSNLPIGPLPEVPFVPCGDPYGFDSEKTYPLSDDE
ncbi:FtsJ-like methyltransferase family protein [Tritrichomonas foetus]|uniref:FtsJ-like methyltransferase family protein n=1 Tax=Tritrichomonas foetus TaxID=1144522 RepID=A0A1J4KVJ3_9EUKA|nr:FtsJ-like methyltransferase family protein [Tritrichomonas foetus]|eukprot:OHT15329.1 FtsJ-like methyltransferase family protein [Tritrichomonas foetus]